MSTFSLIMVWCFLASFLWCSEISSSSSAFSQACRRLTLHSKGFPEPLELISLIEPYSVFPLIHKCWISHVLHYSIMSRLQCRGAGKYHDWQIDRDGHHPTKRNQKIYPIELFWILGTWYAWARSTHSATQASNYEAQRLRTRSAGKTAMSTWQADGRETTWKVG